MAFTFNLKSSFCSQDFCLDLLVMYKNDLIRNIRLILKFMTCQPEKPTIAAYIFLYISKSKDNQIMKFDQLIEYNMRNIFLKKSYTENG